MDGEVGKGTHGRGGYWQGAVVQDEDCPVPAWEHVSRQLQVNPGHAIATNNDICFDRLHAEDSLAKNSASWRSA